MAEPPRLPPPNRNRLLPISIALSRGRNPRIRGFGWGRAGVGGRAWGHSLDPLPDPHPRPLPTRGRGAERAPHHMRLPCGREATDDGLLVRPLELAQQVVTAFDGALQRYLGWFLSGEGLLEFLFDDIANLRER